MNQHRWHRLAATCAVAAVAVGSVLASSRPATASTGAVTVASFSPTSGVVGTSVTITGSGFTGATSVTFQKVAATFTVNSDSQITATVPSGALTGKVGVVTPGGGSRSHSKFKVIPQVTDYSPKFGPAGTSVTITGTAFTKATSVTFNGVAATFTVNSYGQISTTVPAGATTGPLAVTTNGGTGTSSSSFTVGQVFSVIAYGAHGDGTGDNSPAFRSAIAAAQAAGGGIVYAPSGTYTMSSTTTPASLQIDGTVPITFAGAGRDATTLMELTLKKDLLSTRCDGIVIEDMTLDTQTHSAGHGIGDGGSNTTVQRIRVLSGTRTFGIYYPGPHGAHPGNGLYSSNNVINDVILNDHLKSDGFSFSFQKNGSISNIQHTGSRLSLYADTYVTVTNYTYTPGAFGGTAGWVISTPCDHITITNFVSSGQGGQINNAPDVSRVNQSITINGERMTGGPSFRLLIGDVQNLLVENSSLDEIIISPKHIAQGTVTSSTWTKVLHRPQKGATDAISFS